jgi:hypothetical protein
MTNSRKEKEFKDSHLCHNALSCCVASLGGESDTVIRNLGIKPERTESETVNKLATKLSD